MAAGSFRYWAAALQARHVIIDSAEKRLPLRHSHHRYDICGPNGVQHLTIPVVAETHTMATLMHDVRISEHAHWRRVHWGALYSAYGKTPYFDYVADDLQRIVMGNQHFLLDFNQQLQELITDFMALPIEFEYRNVNQNDTLTANDLRQVLGSKKADNLPIIDVQYYQLWQDRFGFIPHLSIIDLMMNTGREGLFNLLAALNNT
ncbi:MAG: WbqC family protein [Muribaculaceae bacterium]|nr:WbqC family protein [Muribaculaceae bacterium]